MRLILAPLCVAAAMLPTTPLFAHHCNHHYAQHCSDCSPAARTSRRSTNANVQSREGTIVEVIYLPGITPDSAMVETQTFGWLRRAAGAAWSCRLPEAESVERERRRHDQRQRLSGQRG